MANGKYRVLRGVLIWISFAWGVGLLPAVAGTSKESDRSEYAFHVEVPEPRFLQQPDGSSKVEIVGFGTKERRPGAPDLSARTFLLAIPAGATPRVLYSVRGELRRYSKLPTPVSVHEFDPFQLDGDALMRADRDPVERFRLLQSATVERAQRNPIYYQDEKSAEQPWVRLGTPGILRSQRYVPVTVDGAHWSAATGRIEVPRGLDIRVVFDGVDPEAPYEIHASEPLFEAVYRASFENYEQGRTFRLGSDDDVQPALASVRALGGTPRHKIFVTQNGPLRLDFALLSTSGLLAHPLDSWRLENRGEQIPLQILDDGDGILEPGEWVQFYGQALDSEPFTELNTDIVGTDTDLFEDRDFSDRNVYFLTIAAPGQASMPASAAAPQFVLTPPLSVTATVHAETNDAFRPLGGADPWYWLPTLFATGTPMQRTETLALPGLHDGTLGLQVRAHLRGASESQTVTPDHSTTVSLLNQMNQVLAADSAMFDGRTLFLHDFPWVFPGGGAQATDPVKIELEVFDVGGGARNDVILDYLEVDYQRSLVAANDRFEFVWPNNDAEFVVDGFSSGAVELWELTSTSPNGVVHPLRRSGVQTAVSGAMTFSARFFIANDGGISPTALRRFVVFESSAPALVSAPEFAVDTVSDLRDSMNQANLVVIAHGDVLDASTGSALDQLLAYRATPAGGGLSSKVATLEDIEDEFNFGLAGPQAIREFLRWIVSTAPGEGWSTPKPTHVLLLGDGSFDYKGGTASGNYVPTQIVFKDVIELGYYASDNLLATVAGTDQLADLIVGRLPARSLGEANGYLQKILNYETVAPVGDWQKHAVVVSDQGKPGNNPAEALEFELTNALGLAEIEESAYTTRELRYWSDLVDPGVVPMPWETMRQEIKDAVNGNDGFSGAALLQFAGHGNFVVWSDDAFFDERDPGPYDTNDLTNGLQLPFLIVHNCLTGGFHTPLTRSMGEDWLRRNGGGAIGVFAPSGLSFNFVGRKVTQTLWEGFFGPTKRRDIATPVLSALTALCTQGSIEPCQQYILLGDPATRLRLRSTEPISNLAAVASNLRVDLTWTASPTPNARYSVVRTEFLNPPFYVPLTPSPIAATSFPDLNVDNGTTYYYHVVATDPEGFVSAFSNFQSDCGGAGPDCVMATPTNPNPPGLPTGFAVQDPGQGTQLRFLWNTNPEADIAYYTFTWGVGSNNPTFDVQATLPTLTLTGLNLGETVCATISATNTSNKTSAATGEVCDFPVSAPGVRLPQFISDLDITAQGADIRLDWSAVTQDVYGKPVEVLKYEILRGDAPNYANASLVKIGECVAPCSSFLDPGSATNGIAQHYRVRAVSVAGFSGALGSEAPAGVELNVFRGTQPGDVLLSWTPATETLDGAAVSLLHYLVFAQSVPVSKDDVINQIAIPFATVSGTTLELTPSISAQFYSVYVVDTRGNISPY